MCKMSKTPPTPHCSIFQYNLEKPCNEDYEEEDEDDDFVAATKKPEEPEEDPIEGKDNLKTHCNLLKLSN